MVTSRGPTAPAEGERCAPARLDEAQQAAALELAHTFPGPLPVVVIARPAGGFDERLRALLAELQAESSCSARVQRSREGRFMSVRLVLQVESAAHAIAIRNRLAELDGVLMLL